MVSERIDTERMFQHYLTSELEEVLGSEQSQCISDMKIQIMERYHRLRGTGISAADAIIHAIEAAETHIVDLLPERKKEDKGVAIDVHSHTKLTRQKPFNERDLSLSIIVAQKRGIDGFLLTEHLDSPDYELSLQRIESARRKGTIPEDFLVFSCAEVRIQEGNGDILLIATPEQILLLNRYFHEQNADRGLITQGYYPRFLEFFEALGTIEGQTGSRTATLATHIFRKQQMLCDYKTLKDTQGVDLRMVDGIDSSAKELPTLERAKEKALQIGKPVCSSSDGHSPIEKGNLYTVFPEETRTLQDIVNALKSKNVSLPQSVLNNSFDFNGAMAVAGYARTQKNIIKAIGNYTD